MCSKPEEMNITMQIQMEKILETYSWDSCASHSAVDTRKLHAMPRVTAMSQSMLRRMTVDLTRKQALELAYLPVVHQSSAKAACASACVENTGSRSSKSDSTVLTTPLCQARHDATSRAPHQLPYHETMNDRIVSRKFFFVGSSIIMSPKGIPNPPNMRLFWPVVPPQRPPTCELIVAPRPRNRPPSTERKKSLRWPYAAFFLPAARNCSSTSALVNWARRDRCIAIVPGWMPDIVVGGGGAREEAWKARNAERCLWRGGGRGCGDARAGA